MINDSMGMQPLRFSSELSEAQQRLAGMEREADELLGEAATEQSRAATVTAEITGLSDQISEALSQGQAQLTKYQERCDAFQVFILDRREQMSALQGGLEELQGDLNASNERLIEKMSTRHDRQTELFAAQGRYVTVDRELERLRRLPRPEDVAAIRNYEQPEDVLMDAVGRPQAAAHEQELEAKAAAKREAEERLNQAEARFEEAEAVLQAEVSHYQSLEARFQQGLVTSSQLEVELQETIEKLTILRETHEQVSRYTALLHRMTRLVVASLAEVPAQSEPAQEVLPVAIQPAPETLPTRVTEADKPLSDVVSVRPASLLVTASRGRHAAPDTARVDVTGNGRVASIRKLLPTNGGTES